MLKYVVKKRVFGFDKTKAEKFVAQSVITNSVKFEDLCSEISKVGLVPTGVVKFVLDGLIDTLNINLNKGMSVQLGNFGCFRPGINCKSQDKEEDVNTKCIQRVKIIFTPGGEFREMLGKASLERLHVDGIGKDDFKPDDQHKPDPKDDEAPDPKA
jgi:predicted histone-like DNA-binding protein